ncbi:hypothetical protein [Micromonospora sp. IBHARD004]|uniref:hypothetical protein n=1 Tax=Micromonospora sp. IBHARD004 TaxID=3457764 RepID=UPI0040596DCC
MSVPQPADLDLLPDDLRDLLVPLLRPAPIPQGRLEEWKAERRAVELQGQELVARVVTAPALSRGIVTDAICRRWLDAAPTAADKFWFGSILRARLAEQVILPTLLERLARPSVPELRWLYQVCVAVSLDLRRVLPFPEDEDAYGGLLREALALDPDDVMTWRLLADLLLDRVGYGTHEWSLGRGPVDGGAEEWLETAREAELIIASAPPGALPTRYAEEIRDQIGKLTSWIEYKAAEPGIPFFDWLRM